MPKDSKKNADKKKNDPKEQRKPSHSRNQAAKAEKTEEIKAVHKGVQKPAYEDPGPEFYKKLKRETEEIVKITESENAKYKKKEIQSNWAKYEMPIASYEDVDDQDVGADYEKLIEVPLSVGGHFQFKHEKSWDTSPEPSLYDKYFEIDMDYLALAISTVPFFERNDLNQSLFTETDLLSMNNRASKYKLKYFNDKSYSTPETDAQDRISKSLCLKEKANNTTECDKVLKEKVSKLDDESDEYNVNLDSNVAKIDSVICLHNNEPDSKPKINDSVDDFDDEFVFKDKPQVSMSKSEAIIEKVAAERGNSSTVSPVDVTNNTAPNVVHNSSKAAETKLMKEALTKEHPGASIVNPVIESPEDLEKWLDDFLDS